MVLDIVMVRLGAGLVCLLLTGCKKTTPNEPKVDQQQNNDSHLAPGVTPTGDQVGFPGESKPKTGARILQTESFPVPLSAENLQSVKFYYEHLSSLRSKLSKVDLHDPIICPPLNFNADGKRVRLDPLITPTSYGSMYFLNGQNQILKVVEPRHIAVGLTERAALNTITRSSVAHIAPKSVISTSLADACDLRSVVMETVDGTPLFALPDEITESSREITHLALGALQLLEQLHSIGLVHGDVHAGNLLSDPESGKLTMIDFDRAIPYVDAAGNHVSNIPNAEAQRNLNALILSIGELEGFALSRRDDLFRLAEQLVSAIDGFDPLWVELASGDCTFQCRSDLANLKRNRTFSDKIPAGFIEFYKATVAMNFYENPDYFQLASFLKSVA